MNEVRTRQFELRRGDTMRARVSNNGGDWKATIYLRRIGKDRFEIEADVLTKQTLMWEMDE